MKKLMALVVVVVVAFSTLFAGSGKMHMTPKAGIGFGYDDWNMIGITAGFDFSFRVLEVKKKPGMGLYVGGEADFTVWPSIGHPIANVEITNFEIPLLGAVRFQIPINRTVKIVPYAQTGVSILFASNVPNVTGLGLSNAGSASAAFAFNTGAEFVFHDKFVLRPHFDWQGTSWYWQNHVGAFVVDFGYRIVR